MIRAIRSCSILKLGPVSHTHPCNLISWYLLWCRHTPCLYCIFILFYFKNKPELGDFSPALKQLVHSVSDSLLPLPATKQIPPTFILLLWLIGRCISYSLAAKRQLYVRSSSLTNQLSSTIATPYGPYGPPCWWGTNNHSTVCAPLNLTGTTEQYFS